MVKKVLCLVILALVLCPVGLWADEAETPDAPPKVVPDVFQVKFECSNGEFVAEFYKDWSPLGVERIYELVDSGFFSNTKFFRVVPNFIVQFGISGDPAISAKWRNANIKDDRMKPENSNKKGTITFATAGPGTRTSQLFINFSDNTFLDRQGFTALGKVIKGMNVVEKIYPGYGEKPNQGLIQSQGDAYLSEKFPKMDYIISASFVTPEKESEEKKAEEKVEEKVEEKTEGESK